MLASSARPMYSEGLGVVFGEDFAGERNQIGDAATVRLPFDPQFKVRRPIVVTDCVLVVYGLVCLKWASKHPSHDKAMLKALLPVHDQVDVSVRTLAGPRESNEACVSVMAESLGMEPAHPLSTHVARTLLNAACLSGSANTDAARTIVTVSISSAHALSVP